jgi:hypothetical protein
VLLERDGNRTLIVKGAPEHVIRISTRVEVADGIGQELTGELRERLQAQFEQLSSEGFRLLGIASREEPVDRATCVLSDEAELTFAGFAVFLDPPKASAGKALAALAAAGVTVKVLTGDNEQVARHLCGELDFDPGEVLIGKDLATLSDEALIGRLADTRLFCRVTPQQKLRVITALKRVGQTIGFLGDGINDAPTYGRQHWQIHTDGQQRQFRKHLQHGASWIDSAFPPASADPSPINEPDLRLCADSVTVGLRGFRSDRAADPLGNPFDRTLHDRDGADQHPVRCNNLRGVVAAVPCR